MIKANELRIGNLVTINNPKYHPSATGKIVQVIGIYPTQGYENEKSHGVNLEEINQLPNTYYENYSQFICFIDPIPLTEEWLLKFGATKQEDKVQFKIDPDRYIDLMITKEGIYPFLVQLPEMSCEDLMIFPCMKLDFVHEIQNLFFSILGYELVFSSTEP